MGTLIVFAAPMILLLGIALWMYYAHIKHGSPVALGSALPKLCVVSADEIYFYCENAGKENEDGSHLRQQAWRKQLRVTRGYVGQMACNTKLFQRVALFEEMKIDPAKSSLEYETQETLILRLVDESAQVRWLLAKAQMGLAIRVFAGPRTRQQALAKVLQLVAEYKQLEQDVVALVGMASDDCYYTMLVERLGLSNWRLFDGGSVPTSEQ
jgi:hypothetical protein